MTFSSVRRIGFLSIAAPAAFLVAGIAVAADALNPPMVNWTPPATWSSRSRGATTMGDISYPALLVSIAACRQYDSRLTTPLLDNTPRFVTLVGAPCGIPSAAVAVAVNITVLDISGQTGNAVFKVGTTSPPTTGWLNYPIGQGQIDNAGVLATNGTGFYAQVNQGGGQIDFIVDVYGYYLDRNGAYNTNEFVGLAGNTGTAWCAWIFASNNSTSTDSCIGAIDGFAFGANSYGVKGEGLGSAGSIGVIGITSSTTNGGHGVMGTSPCDTSNCSAVYGASGFHPAAVGFTTSGAGVWGQGRNGVVGTTWASGLGESGVIGVVTTTAGGLGPFGYLGYPFSNKAVEAIGDYGGTGAKYFQDPHPTDPTKMIQYVALEGPESGTYFRGTGTISGGQYVINVPEDFRLVTDPEGLTVQLTPVGAPASMFVVNEDLNQIIVHADADVKFHYLVNGVRATFNHYQPIVDSLGIFVPLSPTMQMSSAFSPEQRRRLVANGTFNADGTINMETARARGWTKFWEERSVTPPSVQQTTTNEDNKPH